MPEETTLRQEQKRTNELLQKLLESPNAKKIRIKGMRIGRSQVKKNYVQIFYINDNREIAGKKVPIEEATAMLEGIPRLATTDYMLSYNGKPALIIPAWSVKPFSPVDSYEDAVKEKMTTAGYKLLLNRIEQGEIKGKKTLSGKVIFFGIAALLVIGYLVLSG